MDFFGAMLFPSPSRAISFVVLPLVNVLPHGFCFIPALLSKTIRSLSLCRETGRDQPMGFVHRNRVRSTVFLDLPFSDDING